jgi:hypothetical protein
MGELLSYEFTNVVYFKPLPLNMVENAPNGNPKFGLGISPNLDVIHQHRRWRQSVFLKYLYPPIKLQGVKIYRIII